MNLSRAVVSHRRGITGNAFRHSLLSLSLLFLLVEGCSKRTDDPERTVVKLRDRIMDLVAGRASEIIESGGRGEYYVFLDGYMSEDSFRSLAIPRSLQVELARISPSDEKYALARIVDDHVTEYTFFPHGWPRDPSNTSQSILIKPCPLVINGNSRIIKNRSSNNETILSAEPRD